MNIVYSSDENYVQHMAVSIFSLLENNKEIKEINIYILSNDISGRSKEELSHIVEEQFHRNIIFIEFASFKERLNLNMEWFISLSAYARLFLPEMLPDNCEKVIYIDSDTVICTSLSELWNTDLKNCSVGGVLDTVLPQFKSAVGLKKEDAYINSGILLIDIKKWRNERTQDEFVQFIEKYGGRVSHHDQGTINGVLHDKILVLNPRFNVMTPMFTTRYENLFKLYRIAGKYYSKDEILEAKQHPVIIHFVPEFVGRVWEYECRHPKKKLYRKYLEHTVWRNHLVHSKTHESVKIKMIHWIQCRLPLALQKVIGM